MSIDNFYAYASIDAKQNTEVMPRGKLRRFH